MLWNCATLENAIFFKGVLKFQTTTRLKTLKNSGDNFLEKYVHTDIQCGGSVIKKLLWAIWNMHMLYLNMTDQNEKRKTNK